MTLVAVVGETGIVMDTKLFSEEIRKFTSGYPYLVSRLCKNIDEESSQFIATHVPLVMFGFHSNVARTFAWFLLHARRYPEVMRRCREEVQMKTSDKEVSRTYLEACIRETGRLYSNIMNMGLLLRYLWKYRHYIIKLFYQKYNSYNRIFNIRILYIIKDSNTLKVDLVIILYLLSMKATLELK